MASRARRLAVRRLARPSIDAASQREPEVAPWPNASPPATPVKFAAAVVQLPLVDQVAKRRRLDDARPLDEDALAHAPRAPSDDMRAPPHVAPSLHLAPPRRPPGSSQRPAPRSPGKAAGAVASAVSSGDLASTAAADGRPQPPSVAATEVGRDGPTQPVGSSLETGAEFDDSSMEPTSTAPSSLPSLFDTSSRFDPSMLAGSSSPGPSCASPSALSHQLAAFPRAPSSLSLPSGPAAVDPVVPAVPSRASFPSAREREESRQRVAASVAAAQRGLAALSTRHRPLISSDVPDVSPETAPEL